MVYMLDVTWKEFGEYLFVVKRLKRNNTSESCYRTRFAIIIGFFLKVPYTEDNLYKFFDYLQNEKKLKNNSLNNYLKLIKHLNSYFKMDSDFFKNFRYYDKSVEEPEVLTLDELENIIKEGYRMEYRIGVLFEVYAKTALRNNEALDLTWDCLRPDRLLLKDTKSNKPQRVYIMPDLYGKINELKKYPHGYIFGTSRGRLDRMTVNSYLKRAAKSCGITKRIYCHLLRHTTATMAANTQDVNPFKLQQFLRHADLSTTMNYVHMNIQAVKDISESLPLNRGEVTFEMVKERVKKMMSDKLSAPIVKVSYDESNPDELVFRIMKA